ncbi:hypothetical protein LDENG_00048200 [Lucifuga dentata]|nr:hypothetical protein LDENG_00048200 [Lucifuga dentata]
MWELQSDQFDEDKTCSFKLIKIPVFSGERSIHKQLDESLSSPRQLKMMLLWKQIVLLSITGCLADDVVFQGPRWRTEPGDLVLPINSPSQQAIITCEAEGSPPPQYRWSLNGTLIDPGNDYRRHMSGGNLIINNLDKDQDAGIYQCTAFNTWGSILSRRAGLQFAYLDNFKTQTVRSAVNVREGQGVVLLCGPPTHSGGKLPYLSMPYLKDMYLKDMSLQV